MRLPACGPGERLVGVAVTLPEPYRGELADARARTGDPDAAHVQPHVTLVGPLPVPAARTAALDDHLRTVAAAHGPFEVHLRGAGTFRPVTPVVFVPLVRGADECTALERALRTGPLAHEPRYPYHPHVTVAHALDDAALDAAQAAMGGYEASFLVTHLHRYVHDGRAWRQERAFALSGDVPADGRTPQGRPDAAAVRPT
ncbi:2'-5' RNA ligase family protein [Cellulomonas sp. JZ18]|uniref:2'-5' RNA ligase family protein n=1 Tax=Cellulomonas sp. JZ18 TaxID=2654191 RepID=UPI0012D4B822|nr:2'-5' RNA ligase family protein [Cellulomonas sp. JZ18]QGQ20061.1 2'-5' RNA ligase family protein [Cellulomonas sp. JZ18]